MAQYVCRRLSQLPVQEEGRARTVSLATSGNGRGVEIQHVVLGPAAKVPVEIHDEATARVLTLSGRGAATVGGDRIELHHSDIIEIEPGCPYALQSIGSVDWTFLLIKTEA